MTKYFIGVVVFVIVAVGAYYVWQAMSASSLPPTPPPPPAPVTRTYATSTFSLAYPSDYTVDATYTYDAFEGKPIAGVKFTVPSSLTEGANLSSDTGVSVEWLPRANKCTGDIYVVPNVKALELTVGSTTYSVATTSEAAAGNLYEEQVYAIAASKPCTAVRFFIHSTSIGNYEPGAVREFDRATLLDSFKEIRDSLILNP